MSTHVIAQQWVSLDGYASGETDESEIFAAVPAEADASSMEHNARLLPTVRAALLGRRSYETFVQFWPAADLPVAEHVNTMTKVVFSRTLDAAPWGRFEPAQVERDALSYVQRHRERGDGDLLVWGSLHLMWSLLRAGQLDELDLFVAPVALGAGTPLLPPGLHLDLDLVQAETWASVAHLRYRVGRG